MLSQDFGEEVTTQGDSQRGRFHGWDGADLDLWDGLYWVGRKGEKVFLEGAEHRQWCGLD